MNIATGATNAKAVNIGTANQLANTITIGNASSSIALSGTLRITEGNQGAGKSLYSDASGGATWQTPSSTLKTLTKITTAVTVNNTTTESNLVNYTVPANTLGTNKKVILHMRGDLVNNSGATRDIPIFRVKYGGTTFLASNQGLANWVAGATRYHWQMDVEISALGATNSQLIQMDFWGNMEKDGTAATNFSTGSGKVLIHNQGGHGFFYVRGGNTGTIDSTSDQALVVSIQFAAANASLEYKLLYASVEVIE